MEEKARIDPFLLVILKRRVEAIITEMVNALLKSGRSGVLNTAMDFSCSLTDNKYCFKRSFLKRDSPVLIFLGSSYDL